MLPHRLMSIRPLNKRPHLLSSEVGSTHPLMSELKQCSISSPAWASRLWNRANWMMTGICLPSLNFPEGHPARDDYDTFVTTDGLIAPTHASIMQNRLLKKYRVNLETVHQLALFMLVEHSATKT